MTPFLHLLSNSFRVIRSGVFLLVITTVLLSACSKPSSEYQNLSEKPPLSIIPYTHLVNESIIQTSLSIPLARLKERLEADVPESLYDDPGKIKQKCLRIFGKNLCETYQVGGRAERTGPIQLTPLNNGFLRIALPLQYKLKVQGQGKIVKELLRNIDFKTAAFTVIADVQPQINSDWQLQLMSNATIRWDQSPRVKILGVELNIQDKVEKPIKKALNKALLKQQQKLANDNRLKESVEKFWLTLQEPRKLSGPFPLWLQANPQALNLSKIEIDQEAIRVSLSLRTLLSISGSPRNADEPAKPLPPLTNRLIKNSNIRINLPLALAYTDLATSLQERLSNKPLEYKQGKTSILVKAIDIYPNNERLVLAAKVQISGLADLLVSDGEIYISGKPVIDNNSKILRLTDVAFSRQLDGVFWNTATRLLQEQLLSGLQNALVYDFSDSYAALNQSINEQLQSQHGKKIKLNGQLYRLEIQGIQPDLDELRLIVEAQGVVNLELTNL